MGWWLHSYCYISESRTPETMVYSPDNYFPPLSFDIPGPVQETIVVLDTQEFQFLLNEGRFDDALTLYQEHESTGSASISQLRQMLISSLAQWQKAGDFETCINALERFTQYYYQDIELLKVQVAVLESNNELMRAIDVCVMASPFTARNSDFEYFNESAHRLARNLFSSQRKQDAIESGLPLFQKLAFLEPDYAFYRYALAEIYLVLGDTESAIRELEVLQLDHEFGRQASRILAELFPAAPEEPDEIPPGVIPLMASGRHFLAPVKAGDKETARLLIDTGASLTTMPSQLLLELKRKKQAARVGHVELKTANGFRFSPLYRIKSFQIGEYILKDLEVAALDMGSGESADGLLGMNVLSQFMFQIDQDRQALILIPR